MIQTDGFGNFNRDVRMYNMYLQLAIVKMANELRSSLERLSDPHRQFHDTDGYINEVVEGYTALAHLTHLSATERMLAEERVRRNG